MKKLKMQWKEGPGDDWRVKEGLRRWHERESWIVSRSGPGQGVAWNISDTHSEKGSEQERAWWAHGTTGRTGLGSGESRWQEVVQMRGAEANS